MPEKHEERVSQLAEKLDSTHPEDLSLTQAIWPDKRFASLRGKHEPLPQSIKCRYCGRLGPWYDDAQCYRADADALLEAVKQCGWEFGGGFVPSTGHWSIGIHTRTIDTTEEGRMTHFRHIAPGIGDTAAEALSAALWTAIFEASHDAP